MEKKTSGDEIALSKTESEYITIRMIRDNLGEQYQYCSKSSSAEKTTQDRKSLSKLSAIYLSKKGAGDGETIYKVTWDLKDDGTIVNVRVEIVEAVPEMADTEKPIIEEVKITEVTLSTIKIEVVAYDAEETDTSGCSGIDFYYYSRDGGSTWEPVDGIEDETYTFTGLTKNTEYSIKVKVVDGAGNETISDAVTGKTLEEDYVDYAIDINGDGITTNDWRLFYVNDELDEDRANGNFTTTNTARAFLIAADYVESDNELLDLKTAEMYRVADYADYSSYKYSVNWYDSSTSSYTLLSTGTHYSGNAAVNSNIASLFMYSLHYTTYPTQAQINTRATASLLDVMTWKDFADGAYGEYAIGGSTLEMWVASWNKKHGYEVDEEGNLVYGEEGGQTLYCNKVYGSGYMVGNKNAPSSYEVSTSAYPGFHDSLYFPLTVGKVEIGTNFGYWLASPSYGTIADSVSVYKNGRIGNNSCAGQNLGVRPVVVLSASVSATYNSTTGIWSLSK